MQIVCFEGELCTTFRLPNQDRNVLISQVTMGNYTKN